MIQSSPANLGYLDLFFKDMSIYVVYLFILYVLVEVKYLPFLISKLA